MCDRRFLHRFLFCGIVLLSIARLGAANDGPSPKIYELVQQEQDVRLTVMIPGSETSPYTLPTIVERQSGDSEPVVVFDEILDKADSLDYIDICYENWQSDNYLEYCKDYPEDCKDCDGDSLPECIYGPSFFACSTGHLFHIVDRCVPAGETTYSLSLGAIGPHRAAIAVEDLQECDDDDTDTEETDTETDAGTDADTGGDVPLYHFEAIQGCAAVPGSAGAGKGELLGPLLSALFR